MNARYRSTTLLAALAAIAIAAPFLAGDYLVGVGLTLLSWIALTQSWIVLSGMCGYISLGHAVFYGIGGYVTVLLFGSVSLWIAVPVAGLAAALFAAVVGYPVMRVRGPYFVILTYGMAELVKFIVIDIEAKLGKFGRLLLGAPDLHALYFAMLALAIAGTLLAIAVRRSRLGYGLRAIREDETAAETLGVPVARFKLYAFVLSAFLPGMVGAIMALRTTYFEPLPAFNPVVSFTIVTIAVIGGSDDARGPLLGSLFLVVLSELLWVNAPEIHMILLGLILIGFVLFAPAGLCGWFRRPSGTAA
jgi:branched-chain amino acid transport system permease protein